jgi:hypothetical protein
LKCVAIRVEPNTHLAWSRHIWGVPDRCSISLVPLAAHIAHAAEQDHVHGARRGDNIVGRLDRLILNQVSPRRPASVDGHPAAVLRKKTYKSLRGPASCYLCIDLCSLSLGGFLLPFLRLLMHGLPRGFTRATYEWAARRSVQMTKRALTISAMSDREARAVSASLG